MNKLSTLLAAAMLGLSPALFHGCMDGGTEIPNELRGSEVENITGKPVAGAEVRLIPVGFVPGEDSSNALFTTRTDASGRFVFRNLPGGQYNILAAKDGLLSYRDSVTITGDSQSLEIDTLKAPGSLTGTVKLQPQHDPRTATVQVLGTTLFVNVGEDGSFTLPGLGAGEYRLRVVTIEPGYTPLFRVVAIRSGRADTLAAPLEPFYARIPVVTGLRAAAGPEGTVVLRWNQSAFGKVQAYIVYRDSIGALLPSSAPLGRTTDSVYIDTIYSRTPRATQYPYLDSAEHPFRYRVRILDQGDSLGPVFGSVEGRAIPPSRNFSSGQWKAATAGAAFSKRTRAKAVAFAERLWLFGGADRNNAYLKDLWSSADGVDWQKSAAPLPWDDSLYYEFHPFAFREKLWMMAVRYSETGDHSHALWNSEDGSVWKLVTDSADFPSRTYATVAVFLDKIWILDGTDRNSFFLSDIRTSQDGVTWTRYEPGSGYQATSNSMADTLGGYLWRVGGGSGAVLYTEQIWRYSGSAARMTSDTAAFLGRIGHGLINHGNKLWLIGGTQTHKNDFSLQQLKNDVWSSEDGETWVLRDAHAPFSARAGHACAVFRNRLWVLGGADFEAGAFHNDIWYLEGN